VLFARTKSADTMQLRENDETAMTGLQRAAVIVVPGETAWWRSSSRRARQREAPPVGPLRREAAP
jgi:hypothetical protein